MVGIENLPSLEHLAVAFAVNWIATREPLFGWCRKNQWTHVVRAAGGALFFCSDGLCVDDVVSDGFSYAFAAVSSRAPHVAKASHSAEATWDKLWGKPEKIR
jgi:hypothetical protein